MQVKSLDVTFWCAVSNFFCINPGARMPSSLFTPQCLQRLCSYRSHFLLLKWPLFLHFSLGLIQNMRHWKVCKAEEKRSPSYFKAFEINCGNDTSPQHPGTSWHGGLGKGGRWGTAPSPSLALEDKQGTAATAFWLPALSAGSPAGTDIAKQKTGS